MKTLIELKQAAESKGLRFEVNKWGPDYQTLGNR